jgi:RNA polymerase sigma factor (sigma-70 family)
METATCPVPDTVWDQLFRLLERAVPEHYRSVDREDLAANTILKMLPRPTAHRMLLRHRERIEAGRLPRCLRQEIVSDAAAVTRRLSKRLPISEAATTPDEHWQVDQEPSPLAQLVDNLPDKFRQIVQMKANGFKQPEIAEALGISPRTVRTYLKKVRDLAKDKGFGPKNCPPLLVQESVEQK